MLGPDTLAVVARINLRTKQSSFSVLLLFLSNRYHCRAYQVLSTLYSSHSTRTHSEGLFRQTTERDGTTFPPVDPGEEWHRRLPAHVQVTSGRHYLSNSCKLLLLCFPFGPFRFLRSSGTTKSSSSSFTSLSSTILALFASCQYRRARIHLACA